MDTALTSGIQNIQNTQVNVRKSKKPKLRLMILFNNINKLYKIMMMLQLKRRKSNNLVNASQQNVISKIDNATTNNQIDGIVSDGRQSINAITPDTSIKKKC